MRRRLALASMVSGLALLIAHPSAANDLAKCDAAKLKAAGKAASLVVNAHAKNLTKPNNAKLAAGLAKAEAFLLQQFSKAEDEVCSVDDNASRVFAGITALADSVQAPVDIVLTGETISTPLGDVAATGEISISPNGDAAGAVSLALTPGVTVVVEPTSAGGLQATVGTHLVVMDAQGSNLQLDGTPISLADVTVALRVDRASGNGPEAWSPISQAWLAFLGLTSTPAWKANVQAEIALEESRSPRALFGLFSCKRAVAIAAPVIVELIQQLGCLGAVAVCGGATAYLTFGTLTISCIAVGVVCEVVVAAIDGGLDATDAAKKWLESYWCTTNVCEADWQTRGCYNGDPATRGVGACRDGVEVCRSDGSGFGGCGGEQQPVTEVCGNNQDDNCNGLPDSLDPICGGGGVVGIQQLTTGGAGATNRVLLTADARVVVFDAPGGVFSVRTDGSNFLQYPDRGGIYPPGCNNTGCNYCEGGAQAPLGVDGTGALVAYQAFLNSCGLGSNSILMPQGANDVFAPFGGSTQNPSISVDGSRVAYLKTSFVCWGCGVATEVWVSDPSGLMYSNLILSRSAGAIDPVISGNGQRIVFRRSSGSSLKIVDVDGGEATARDILPYGPTAGRFGVSYDGARVVFESAQDIVPGENPGLNSQIFLWEDGSGIRQLTHAASGADVPAISGDGNRVAFRFAGDLYVHNVATGLSTIAVDLPSVNYAYPPVLDSTGRVLVFSSNADLTGQNESGFVEIFAAQIP